MALTPNDVLNKQFATTRLKEGYDQDEVDDFLDEVLAEFQRLIAENDNLKTQLQAVPAAAPAAADSGEADRLRAQLETAQQRVRELEEQLSQAKEQGGADLLDGMGSAEYLQLARRVHEEHVREGVVKRDQLIAEGEAQAKTVVDEAQAKADSVVVAAQTRASSLVNEAQATANTLVSEAQSKADSLQQEAQARFDSQVAELTSRVSSLTASKTSLEASVADLQEFERSYRASLRAHLEEQLGRLDGGATTAPPASTGSVATSTSPTSVEDSTDEDTADEDTSTAAPTPPVPGLGGDTGEQPSAPRFGY